MPRLEGYEVARRLKAASASVRLIALTGYGRDEDRQRAREAGFDAHLLKPTDPSRLQQMMDSLTGAPPSALPRAAN